MIPRLETHLVLISATIVMKACSTLVAFLALVSRNGIPISSANALRNQKNEAKQNEQTKIKKTHMSLSFYIKENIATMQTFAVSEGTTLLAVMSLLFPIKSLFTFEVLNLSISSSHTLTLLKLSSSVTS